MGRPFERLRVSGEESQAMFEVHDIRETRLYQEAFEEGVQRVRAVVIVRLADAGMTAEQIASILEEDVEKVRQALSKPDQE